MSNIMSRRYFRPPRRARFAERNEASQRRDGYGGTPDYIPTSSRFSQDYIGGAMCYVRKTHSAKRKAQIYIDTIVSFHYTCVYAENA